MKPIRYAKILVLLALTLNSCEDLTELNINPSGVDPAVADPNLLLTTVMTTLGNDVLYQGYFHNYSLAGVMQHLQRDAFSGMFNNFVWNDSFDPWYDWDDKYAMLRTNDLAYKRAVELGLEFHQGVAIILRSMIFARITDLWGDIPYGEALKGGTGGVASLSPKFDSQETIYKGIIEELKLASELLSRERSDYRQISNIQDVYYGGDPSKWRRLANSLALRYYMRLSEKLPDFAEAGVKEMVNQPLITDISHEAALHFIGSAFDNSWHANTVNDPTESQFNRLKPCATLINKLIELDDPRIDVWFSPVDVPIQISDQFEEGDITVDGIRYLRQEYIEENGIKIYNPITYHDDVGAGYTLIDTNSVYVGIPPSLSVAAPNYYNLNPNPTAGGRNIHVSSLADIFRMPAGPNLRVRIFSPAEVYFIKAEAALRGWISDAEGHYYSGVKAALESWGTGNSYESYITNDGVIFNGTVSQILAQKWLSFFTNAAEAWFDWRRTGYPELTAGPAASRGRIPIRFYYQDTEKNRNSEEYQKAIQNLEETGFSGPDGKDSPWSRMWLLQGTGKPW